MTEEQAIERITDIVGRLLPDYPYSDKSFIPHQIAMAAWNEMKAIAREEQVNQHFRDGELLVIHDRDAVLINGVTGEDVHIR